MSRFDINCEPEQLSEMLVLAERYALGRMTYVVKDVCTFVGDNLHLLVDKDRAVMIEDIEYAKDYGFDFDKRQWMELLKKLKGGERWP